MKKKLIIKIIIFISNVATEPSYERVTIRTLSLFNHLISRISVSLPPGPELGDRPLIR